MLGIVEFDQIRGGAIPSVSGSKGGSETLHRAYGGGIGGLMLGHDEGYFLSEMRRQIAIADLPCRSVHFSDDNVPRYALFSELLLPLGRAGYSMRDRGIAHINGDRIFLGLLVYRDRFGSYPATPRDLHAKLDWQLPEDPFSGRPFVYKRNGKGFVLYSVGPDLTDNGGLRRKTPKRSDKPGPPPSSAPSGVEPYDIVWKLDR